ncbi:MFS transporter [Shewanella algidipiscicola]|uniref:MFS transporter n=1 Tax=Shewanella algidipiscicola TaxID=614070 RepID=A0ABQ4PNR2_9GAMM|nr:MFS transporter [Shewanella algidipiscicola]GIU50165.1 MFS transporter [Shewanella algidipiscicola]
MSQQQLQIRLIWGLSLASVVVYINLYLVQGMLPLIASSFQVLPAHATLLLSVTSFSLAFSLLFYATLSDKIGRRKPLLWSLGLLVLADVMLLFVTEFSDLIALRLIQGALLAAVPAISMAYFKDMLDKSVLLKAGAVYIAANSLGGIAGRLLGGVMTQYLNWQQSMLLLISITALGTLVVIGLLPNRDKIRAERGEIKLRFQRSDAQGFWLHLSDSTMIKLYLLGAMAFMVMVNQFSYIQLHLMQAPFNWGRFEVTLIFLCYLSGTYASFRSAKWVNKLGRQPLFVLSTLMMCLGSMVTLVDSSEAIVVGFILSSFGFFTFHSVCNAWVAQRAQQHRAKATALYLCSYYLGAAIGGPYLLPFWQHWGWNGVVGGSLVVLSLVAVLVLYLARAQRRAPASLIDVAG